MENKNATWYVAEWSVGNAAMAKTFYCSHCTAISRCTTCFCPFCGYSMTNGQDYRPRMLGELVCEFDII